MRPLVRGEQAGATGLSNAMKYLSRIESLQFRAVWHEGLWRLEGRLPWVTNLRKQGFLVAAAVEDLDSGVPAIFAMPHDAPGLWRSDDLKLLALQSSNSAALDLEAVLLDEAWRTHPDAWAFCTRARPAFLGLQLRERNREVSHMTARLDTIRAAAKGHCEETIRPEVDTWNRDAAWPRHASDQAAALGLTGLYCPEEWGGQGLSLAEGIQVYEELGKGDGAYAFALSMHNICAYAVCGYGTESLKRQWAHDLTAGRKLANFALTEPQSGSDPSNMFSRARINSDGTWTINGSKAWVSLADEADLYLTVVKTDDAPGYRDMAMIAIPAGEEGLSFGPRYETPSYRFLPMSEMYLRDVTVSEANIVLPVGKGLQGSLMAIDIARVSIAAGCCGLMETALDTALAYANHRRMFGGVTLDLEGIQWMLGEVATDLEVSRLLYRAAAAALGTPEGPLLAAHAKRFVPDAALRATHTCTQVLGGMGLLTSYGLDRLSRLAQMLRIVDGTTEVSRVVIGRALKKRAGTLPALPIPKGFGED